jgi:hypothetical protein
VTAEPIVLVILKSTSFKKHTLLPRDLEARGRQILVSFGGVGENPRISYNFIIVDLVKQ